MVTLGYVCSLACGSDFISSSDATTGTSTSTSTTSVSSTSGVTTSGMSSTSGVTTLSTSTDSDTGGPTETSETTVGCGFIGCYDFGSEEPSCDAYEQDCPEGYKCTIWASDGGGWDDTRCVMVAPAPVPPGEVCVAIDTKSGVDNCELGAYCWDVDPETHEGTCLNFCTGSDWEPVCEGGHACVSLSRGGANAGLCVPTCDPLGGDCADDEKCYPYGNGWLCTFDGVPEAGVSGTPCWSHIGCDTGFYCLGQEYIPGCEEAHCCTAVCDLEAPTTCVGTTTECIPWYEDEEDAPEGYENLGACGVPN